MRLLDSGPETAAAEVGAIALRIRRLPAGTGTVGLSSPAGATEQVGTESPWAANAAVAAGGDSDGRIAESGYGAGGTGGLRVPETASGGTEGGCSRRRGSGEAGRMSSRGCGRLGAGGSRTETGTETGTAAGADAGRGVAAKGESVRGWWAVEGVKSQWSRQRSAMSWRDRPWSGDGAAAGAGGDGGGGGPFWRDGMYRVLGEAFCRGARRGGLL